MAKVVCGVVLSLLLLVGFHLPVQSQSRKEIYELQERCGKSASEMFGKDFPKEERKGLENFENHYNVRLNKCFMLEDNMLTTRDQGKVYQTRLLTLVDVHGNKAVASFSPLNCDVQEKKCRTEEEFRVLIRPFMED